MSDEARQDLPNGQTPSPSYGHSNSQPATQPAAQPQSPPADGTLPARINWDDSNMATVFANVVNVLQTREEIAILFGTNLTWNAFESREITVNLTNRIVLTPHAAKRLSELLNNRLRDYESRFGTLTL